MITEVTELVSNKLEAHKAEIKTVILRFYYYYGNLKWNRLLDKKLDFPYSNLVKVWEYRFFKELVFKRNFEP